MQSDWNASVGAMTSFVITERTDTTEEESPGFGAVLSVVTVLGAASVVILAGRRRRP